MKFVPLFSIALAFLYPSIAYAQDAVAIQMPEQRDVLGVADEEADLLLAQLRSAQERLTAGEFENFVLMAGSIASYEQANIPPREIFLGVDFGSVWRIECISDQPATRQSFRLSYAPDGPGARYWDIRVTLRSDSEIDSVFLQYRVPPPF